MNRKLLILLVVAATAYSAPLFVLDSLTNQYTKGTAFTQVYEREQWNNYIDFAVYGWMKIDSSFPRTDYSLVFQLSQNPDNKFQGTQPGDQKLSFFVRNNNIHNPTYSGSLVPASLRLLKPFTDDDLDSWAFVYMGIGSDTKQASIYAQFKKTVIQYTMPKVVHYPSTFYKLYIGQACTWKYFQGTIAKVFIDAGPTAYRESGFNALQTIQPDTPAKPLVLPQCITFYDQCYFQGNSLSVCKNIPNIDLALIKSIYIPNNLSFSLYKSAQYQGPATKFTESKLCIDILDGQTFAQIASIEKTTNTNTSMKGAHLKRNSK